MVEHCDGDFDSGVWLRQVWLTCIVDQYLICFFQDTSVVLCSEATSRLSDIIHPSLGLCHCILSKFNGAPTVVFHSDNIFQQGIDGGHGVSVFVVPRRDTAHLFMSLHS